MQDISIPQGYQRVMPYLIIPNAAGFIEFTKTVFGAIEKNKMMRDEHTIAHAEVQIGESTIMLADSTELFAQHAAGLFVYVENADETYKNALAAGATSVMELSDQPYGRTCGVKDAFGNTWWVTKNV